MEPNVERDVVQRTPDCDLDGAKQAYHRLFSPWERKKERKRNGESKG